MGKGLQIAIGGVAIALLLGWYGMSRVDEGGFVYYQTLGEYVAAGETHRPARVHGYVVPGTIDRDVEGQQVRFLVQETAPHAGGAAGPSMSVVYASLEVPDLFKDGAEVVVEGRLDGGSDFHATNVLAKCPSKFEAAAAEGAGQPQTPL